MNQKFTVSEIADTSWHIFKSQILLFVGLFTLYFIVCLFISILHLPLVPFIVSSLWGLGYTKNILQTLDGEEPQQSEYNKQASKVFKAMFSSLLMGIIVLGGLVLFILPGLYFAIRFQFALMFIVEENVGIKESLEKSWNITRGHLGDLILLGFAQFGIILIGIVLMGIGFLFACPLVYIMRCVAYRRLTYASAIV